MRRKDKEITDMKTIEGIIKKATICNLALCQDNIPYIVPLNFGYKDGCLYFHSAKVGKKLDMIRENNNVCVEFDIGHRMNRRKSACDWSFDYKSVVGFGKAFLIDDQKGKRQGLEIIMNHYSKRKFKFLDEKIRNVLIIKIKISKMTGKTSD
jgi:uncharacterized protein